jgi:hypothetical protein
VTAREIAVRRIVDRAEGDWVLATLGVLALPERVEDALSAVGAAMRAARAELGTNPRRSAPGVSLDRLEAADESQRRYQGADEEYAIREKDIHAMAMGAALDALERSLSNMPEYAITDALETLYPLIKRVVRGKPLPAGTPARWAGWASRYANLGREQALRDLGTVARSKSKRMKTRMTTPTSGTASRPVVMEDPASGHTWVDLGDHYVKVPAAVGMLALRNTGAMTPIRTGTERREHSDDILADLKRPVRTPGRNSGKQKGRVGGPMITRGGRP